MIGVFDSGHGGLTVFRALALRFPRNADDHEFIPRLWATRRVGYLLDEIRLHGENSELRDEVTDLARKYRSAGLRGAHRQWLARSC